MRAPCLLLGASCLLLPLLAGCGGSSTDDAKAKSPTLTEATASIGPITAPRGGEDTVCIVKRLDNDEAGFVRSMKGQLSDGSHHMIVYTSTDTVEQLDPHPCSGFGGILNFDGGIPGLDSPNVPIFIVQQRSAELDIPKDGDTPVGFRIEPQQMLLIELHWFNTGTEQKSVSGDFQADYIKDSSNTEVIESSFAFWGSAAIDIPPHSTFQTPVLFQRGLADTKIYAVTTHEHSLGTRMRVWHSADTNVDGKDPLVDGTTWAEPPLAMLNPAIPFEPGEGLAYQCEWNNTTSKRVGFGEGFGDEMCFLWAYYYPSTNMGFDICVNFQADTPNGACNHLIR